MAERLKEMGGGLFKLVKQILKFIFEFIIKLIVILIVILPLYGLIVYDDMGFILKKYDQRFALDAKNLDVDLQFKEMHLSTNTKTDSWIKIKTLGYSSDYNVKELTLFQGNKTFTYPDAKFTVYSNTPTDVEFYNPSYKKLDISIKFHSEFGNGNLKLKKRQMRTDTIYELDISNFDYNHSYSFIDLPETEDIYIPLGLKNNEITVESQAVKEKINVTDGQIQFTGNRIEFYNFTNIHSFDVPELRFYENTKIESLNFTGGSGTFALGPSHFQFTPIDEIKILASEKDNITLEIDPIEKTFKVSGDVRSLKFNGQEHILPTYKSALRDPTFIAAVFGAIIGGLFTIIASRRETAKKDVKTLKNRRSISSRYVSNWARNYLRKR